MQSFACSEQDLTENAYSIATSAMRLTRIRQSLALYRSDAAKRWKMSSLSFHYLFTGASE